MSIKIGINGFGRIGRRIFRATLNHSEVEVTAINDLTDTQTIAHLLSFDSVHGRLGKPVTTYKDGIVVDGKKIRVTALRDPAEIPWKDSNVDIVA